VADHLVGGLHCADASDLAAAFVLGALDAAEMDGVRRHLAGCPESHAEFAELGSVVPALFETVDVVEPPAGLRDRILAPAAADTQVAADLQPAADVRRAAADERAVDRHRAPDRAPVPEARRRRGWLSGFRRPVWAGIAVAAALALVALGAWNVQLRDEIAGLTNYRNGVVTVLDEAAQPGARLAVLSVPDSATGPSGLAAISSTGTRVSLVMRDLAPTTGTEVYEAWVITGDNAPVPIGHFTVDASGSATFVTTAPSAGTAPAITVALSREPGPGATTPTTVVALGTAAAS
jgi:anti-sigma factor RsiW